MLTVIFNSSLSIGYDQGTMTDVERRSLITYFHQTSILQCLGQPCQLRSRYHWHVSAANQRICQMFLQQLERSCDCCVPLLQPLLHILGPPLLSVTSSGSTKKLILDEGTRNYSQSCREMYSDAVGTCSSSCEAPCSCAQASTKDGKRSIFRGVMDHWIVLYFNWYCTSWSSRQSEMGQCVRPTSKSKG